MENQVTNNANALRLFFTEEVFLVKDESVEILPLSNPEPVFVSENAPVTEVKESVLKPEIAQIPQINATNIPKVYAQGPEIPHIVAEPLPEKAFKFLGGNKKSVLILVNDKQNDVSTEQGRELLRKIVKAVDLGTPDFAILNYANYSGTDYAELHRFFKPVIMLSFGVEIAELKLNLNWQNEIIVHEATRIIFAPNLHHLDSDLTAKKLLWGHLQKIK
jgi:DNA polymerase III psi subunit